MDDITFIASGIRKVYNRRTIFTGINVDMVKGDSLSVAGRNGAGKSTLLKILAGVLSPTSGTLAIHRNGTLIQPGDHYQCIGFVSPYLQLYDEFTGLENLDLFRKIRGISVPDGTLTDLLTLVNLTSRGGELVRTYSSGMKQRLKYAAALLHEPPILMLDEPSANLDAEGRGIVRRIVDEQRRRGIVVIATNESDEIPWCEQRIDLDAQPSMPKAKG